MIESNSGHWRRVYQGVLWRKYITFPKVRIDFSFRDMLPPLGLNQIFPTVDGIEGRELTEKRPHGAAMSDVVHFQPPSSSIFVSYSTRLGQSHYDYSTEQL